MRFARADVGIVSDEIGTGEGLAVFGAGLETSAGSAVKP